MTTFALLGAGRIGRVHAANIAARADVALAYVVDPVREAAQAIVDAHPGARVADYATALDDAAVEMVLVASPGPRHAEHTVAAVRAGKAVFCEKPFDTDLARARRALAAIAETGRPVYVAFHRRFDPHHRAVRDAARAPGFGDTHMVTITSRDPEPPPPDYFRAAPRPLIRDTMIHDLDMARFLLGQDPTRIYATAAALAHDWVRDMGEWDTAAAHLTTAGGAMAQINVSYACAYGHDQRVEAFGDAGALRSRNAAANNMVRLDGDGVHRQKPLYSFVERYQAAYRAELDHVVAALRDGAPFLTTAQDGYKALALADAAVRSIESGAPVDVAY